MAVRFPEGAAHGFLALRAQDGQDVAAGEVVQTPRGDRVESRLTFRFKDGSLFEETVVFTQSKVLTLLSYRSVQRGPAFPESSEVFFERARGRYKAKIGQETVAGKIDLPPDVYNGMIGMLLKNVAPAKAAGGQVLAFTPTPRFLKIVAAGPLLREVRPGLRHGHPGQDHGQGHPERPLLDLQRGGAGVREVRGRDVRERPRVAHQAHGPALVEVTR